MQIQFWGAARTVTGSMHLLTINGQRLLLDCGLFQGKRDIANERNSQLPFDAKSIDACVLSHAHMDHAGTLPVLDQVRLRRADLLHLGHARSVRR